MRKQDSQEIHWAHESYRQLSRGIYGDGSHDIERARQDVRDLGDGAGEVENQFQKLAERFNEFFGHPSKL